MRNIFETILVGILKPIAVRTGEQLLTGAAMSAGSIVTRRVIENYVDPMLAKKIEEKSE